MFTKSQLLPILFAAVSTLFYSLNQIFNKKLIELTGVRFSLLEVYFLLTVLDFLLLNVFKAPLSIELNALGWLLFISFTGSVAIYYFFLGLERLNVGTALVLANLSPIFLAVITYLTRGVLPDLKKLILIFILPFPYKLIVSGNKLPDSANIKYYLYPLITALGWALFGYGLFYLLSVLHVPVFTVAFYSSLFMFFFLFIAFGVKEIVKEIKKLKKLQPKAFLHGFISAILTSLGFILSCLAFERASAEELPVVEAVLTFTTPLGTLFAYLFLGERLSKKQLIGIAIAFLILLLFPLV
jgi:drug/metabolite transporter (DMT)-like permease